MLDDTGRIELPLDVLQTARKRFTIPLVIRLMAWMQNPPAFKHKILGDGPEHLAIRVPWMELCRDLGIP